MKTASRLAMYALAFALTGVLAQADEAKPQPKESTKDTVTQEFARFALDKAKQYTEKAEDVAEKTVDIMIKEAPETMEQFLKWRFIKHLVSFLIPVSIFIVALPSLFLFLHLDRVKDYDFAPFIVASMVASFFSAMFTAFTIPNLFTAIQIQIAPRIYLLEELGKLLK